MFGYVGWFFRRLLGRPPLVRDRSWTGYVVHEDGPTSRAIVHLEACMFYVNRKADSRHSRWYGPFATIGEAFDTARETGRTTVREGQCCWRQSAGGGLRRSERAY